MAEEAALGDRLSDQGYGSALMSRRFAAFLFAAFTAVALTGASPASAMTIEPIVSPSGIKAWLVREQATPLVALNFAFHGGASQDNPDKSGTANLVADTVDEGAGDLDSHAYHQKLE